MISSYMREQGPGFGTKKRIAENYRAHQDVCGKSSHVAAFDGYRRCLQLVGCNLHRVLAVVTLLRRPCWCHALHLKSRSSCFRLRNFIFEIPDSTDASHASSWRSVVWSPAKLKGTHRDWYKHLLRSAGKLWRQCCTRLARASHTVPCCRRTATALVRCSASQCSTCA